MELLRNDIKSRLVKITNELNEKVTMMEMAKLINEVKEKAKIYDLDILRNDMDEKETTRI